MFDQFLSTLADPNVRAGLASLVAIVLLAVGFCFGRRGRSRLRKQSEDALARSVRAERRAKEAMERVKDSAPRVDAPRSQDTLSSLALSLPHVVSQLNRSDLDFKDIPELILNLAHGIFQPSQALFYVARNKRGGGGRELHLMSQRGLDQIPKEIRIIPFGEGKIGWVAQNRLDKLKSEWRTLWRGEEGRVADNHGSLHIDIVGPMMHHTDSGDNVLGVICLGDPSAQTREEKLLFQMVTNLGSLALVNAMNVHRLRGQANHDGLTGLHNKSFFMREVSARMLTASQSAQQFAVFIFDIDHFKTYNDTNGHPAGDALLKGLSALLKDLKRPGDMLCRYGGEEFMMAMPETDGHTALAVAENVRKMIEETDFEFQENQPNGNLTISGGVAVYPQDGQTLDELIRFADEALYHGKRSGRNAVARYKAVQLGASEFDSEIDPCSVEPTPPTSPTLD